MICIPKSSFFRECFVNKFNAFLLTSSNTQAPKCLSGVPSLSNLSPITSTTVSITTFVEIRDKTIMTDAVSTSPRGIPSISALRDSSSARSFVLLHFDVLLVVSFAAICNGGCGTSRNKTLSPLSHPRMMAADVSWLFWAAFGSLWHGLTCHCRAFLLTQQFHLVICCH